MASVIGTLASIGMAIGPPLVYADQAYSIVKKRDSSGFSHDVCGVVLVANIIRIYFWLGNRFETPLLIQSLLLILAHLFLLSLCLHYAPSPNESHVQVGSRHKSWYRPYGLWQWEGYGSYLEFLAGLILFLAVLQVILGRWLWYIDSLGFIALTIESTLPIPQFISNFQRKSTYGLRASTLAGWFFGDSFKTIYFFLRHSPIQFKITAIMTVCWDTAVFAQRVMYGTEPPRGGSGEIGHMGDELESNRLALEPES
ncbi:PQ loop repeat-domain-containing protein [Naematelia encephala]|uniref:PQ loop repeat-domain-containing protein n=1 Tax=Naematelia encephala TaxID=71784 RepID=A0A1Y2BE52_9TREE|nr:PQ loop repeat-domain-containing protein [Naematelia encephala]